jgi:hypothetical protein
LAQVAVVVRRVTDLLVEILRLAHLPHHLAVVAVLLGVEQALMDHRVVAAVTVRQTQVVAEFLDKVMLAARVLRRLKQVQAVVVDQVQLA